MTLALGINGLTYILPALYWGTLDELIVPMGIVGVIFTLHFTFSREGMEEPRNPRPRKFPASDSCPFCSAVAGKPFADRALVFWFLLAYYEAIGAACVETKLVFRKFPRKYPLITWLPVFIVLAYNPYLLITLVEPTLGSLGT